MKDTTSKEQILKRIRNANMQEAVNPYSNVDLKSNIYTELDDDLEVIFAEELNKVGGHFVYCLNKAELKQNLKRLIDSQKWDKVYSKNTKIKELLSDIGYKAYSDTSEWSDIKASITSCEALVARNGSVIVSARQSSGRRLNFIPDTHIVIANRLQIKESIKEALISIKDKYGNSIPSMISMITGPSRTADIEKTLVMGAHGPRSLIVFLTEEDLLN